MIAEEILDLLPEHSNGEQYADEGRYKDLENIASCSRVKVGECILQKSKLQ